MLWVFTNHHNPPFAADYTAFITDWFDGWSNFHVYTPFRFTCCPAKIPSIFERVLAETCYLTAQSPGRNLFIRIDTGSCSLQKQTLYEQFIFSVPLNSLQRALPAGLAVSRKKLRLIIIGRNSDEFKHSVQNESTCKFSIFSDL